MSQTTTILSQDSSSIPTKEQKLYNDRCQLEMQLIQSEWSRLAMEKKLFQLEKQQFITQLATNTLSTHIQHVNQQFILDYGGVDLAGIVSRSLGGDERGFDRVDVSSQLNTVTSSTVPSLGIAAYPTSIDVDRYNLSSQSIINSNMTPIQIPTLLLEPLQREDNANISIPQEPQQQQQQSRAQKVQQQSDELPTVLLDQMIARHGVMKSQEYEARITQHEESYATALKKLTKLINKTKRGYNELLQRQADYEQYVKERDEKDHIAKEEFEKERETFELFRDEFYRSYLSQKTKLDEYSDELVHYEIILNKRKDEINKDNELFINAMIFYQQNVYKKLFEKNELSWLFHTSSSSLNSSFSLRSITSPTSMNSATTIKNDNKIRVRFIFENLGKQFIIAYGAESARKPIVELFFILDNNFGLNTDNITNVGAQNNRNNVIFEQFFTQDILNGKIPLPSTHPHLKLFISTPSLESTMISPTIKDGDNVDNENSDEWLQIYGPGALVGPDKPFEKVSNKTRISNYHHINHSKPSNITKTIRFDDNITNNNDNIQTSTLSLPSTSTALLSSSNSKSFQDQGTLILYPSTSTLLMTPLSNPTLYSILNRNEPEPVLEQGISQEDRCQLDERQCAEQHSRDSMSFIWHHADPHELSSYSHTIRVRWEDGKR